MSDQNDEWVVNDTVPSASFAGEPPIRWRGTTTGPARKVQAHKYDPDRPGNKGEPQVWPDGNPKMNIWITLQTDVRDPEVEDDDDRRVLVLDSKNKLDSMKAAMAQAGLKRLPVGTEIDITFYGRDPNGKNKDNLPKLYRTVVTPPQEAEDPWGGVASPAPAPTAAPSIPAPATATAGTDPFQRYVDFLAGKGVVGPKGETAKQFALTYPDCPK